MALTALAYKDAPVRKGELDTLGTANKAMADFHAKHAALLQEGGIIRITFMREQSSAERNGKIANLRALDALLSSAPKDKRVWEDHEHSMNFEDKLYIYKGKPVYLTGLQQLALYKVIMLGFSVKTIDCWPQIAYALRRKYGNGFLPEFL